MIAFESWMLGYLLNLLWQLPMIFAAGWIAARLARPAGPRIEHRVWVSALFLEAILPACPVRLAEQLQQLWRLVPWGWTGNSAAGHVRIVIGGGTAHENGLLRLPATVLEALLIAYVGSLLYFTCRLAWGFCQTTVIMRRAKLVMLTGEAAISWNRYNRIFSMDAAELATSAGTSVPVTLGLRRQVLLVPPGLLETVDNNDLDALFAHEFAHMRRRDFAKNLLYELSSLPIACHPLLWLTRSKIAESREMVCDLMAAEAIAGRESYARSLLRLASLLLADETPAPTLHAIGIFDANVFERRIMNLTGKPAVIKRGHRLAITAACAAVALLTCASALALRMEVSAPSSTPAVQSSAKAGNDGTLRVSPEVMAAQKISGPNPTYPPQAKADKVQGAVILFVRISKDGEPTSVIVKKSVRDDVDQSALTAVQQWRWKPFLLNGNPIDVKTTVTVNYTLEP